MSVGGQLHRLTASIVVYDCPLNEIEPLLNVLAHNEQTAKWIVVDNAESDEIRAAVQAVGGLYVRAGKNLGYGGGHNLALRRLAGVDAPYHLMLNPDIAFDESALSGLTAVMDAHPDVGLVMPKVLYPDGSTQYLCKLLPAPIDLVLRRFLPGPLRRIARKRLATYELRNLDYDAPAYVPTLSGCFMFARRSVLDTVGAFDERFFLYMEDVDLCRRMLAKSQLLYWPAVTVRHVHQMGSYRSCRLMLLHVRSAIKYFNKWGWAGDKYRTRINREVKQETRGNPSI